MTWTLPLTALGAALGGGAWAYGTYEPNSPLFGRVIGRGSRAGRVVYLTFDDGPNPRATEPILQTLAAEGIPAAFFLVGEHVRRFPQVARRVAQGGHEIGNHTLRHRKLHFAGPARIRDELERTHALIVETTGRAPRAFRAPHGYRNPFVASAGIHRLRLDLRGVGLGSTRGGAGDPAARAHSTPPRRYRAVARRGRVRSGRRPEPDGRGPPGHHRRCARRGLYVRLARGARRLMSRRWRWVWWLLALVGIGFALKFFTGFPWRVTFAALLDANPWLLAVALAANLSSLVAKGWGWHLVLKPVAPHSWRHAQEANLVGAAVNDLSVAVAGEAARVHVIAQRAGVPIAAAVSSVVWTRLAEALALALFLVMAPSLLQLEPWLRVLQVGVGLALVVVLLLAWARGWSWLAEQLPPRLGARLAVLRTMGRGGRLFVPTLFVPVSLAASFTALIAANLSGLLRPTPANVGVTQAALVVGLLPFGVAPEQAVAAGLALQGLQVLPVLLLGAMVTGWRLLKLETELA